jgi:hypothetical protein
MAGKIFFTARNQFGFSIFGAVFEREKYVVGKHGIQGMRGKLVV